MASSQTTKLYLAGIAMRSYTHDYRQLHSLLSGVDARRVSKRIWLISIARDEEDVFRKMKQSLATPDELLIVELPEAVNGRN